MMKLDIVPKDKQMADNAKKVLNDSLAEEYDTVIVFGFKDGNIQMKISATSSILTLVGALEDAKLNLLSAGGYSDD